MAAEFYTLRLVVLSALQASNLDKRKEGLSLELVEDLLVEHENHPVHVVDANEVGAAQVVLHQAGHTAGPLVPSIVVSWTLAAKKLEF